MSSLVLDQSSYKDRKTSRGLSYHYYFVSPKAPTKPYLLFLHGFPSSSREWKALIDYFQPQGYGIIAPDLLGYGGTDKPTDTNAFRMKFMVGDIIDIVDAEKAEHVIVISHDWGASLCSRLASYHQDRFIAFAFLALSYSPPFPGFDIEALNAHSIKERGYANFGYWSFFAREDAAQIIESHLNSFFSLVYTRDGDKLMKTFCDPAALERSLLADTVVGDSIVSDEALKLSIDEFKQNGFTSPLNWYKAFVNKLTPRDDGEIPKEQYKIAKPVFYGACLQDKACVASVGKVVTTQTCTDATIIEYDVGHWLNNEAPDKLSEDLEAWIKKVFITSSQ